MTVNLLYKSKNKIGPEQLGPKPRIHAKQTIEELKTKPSIKFEALNEYDIRPIDQVAPKLDLNARAINTLPTPKQSEPAKEDVPVKEVIGLLQCTLEAIQILLRKL